MSRMNPIALAVTMGLSVFALAAQAEDLKKSKKDEQGVVPEGVYVPTIEVIGSRIQQQRLPGSGELLDEKAFKEARPATINEVLRKVPGVYVREEEGAGLRPNIGIRGLNPTRSQKVLLLEDGLPLTFAPYGGNESYYHPPVERFSRAEVLKGSGQIAFGPHTVGGVVNYITPRPPEEPSGRVRLTAGERDLRSAYVEVGTTAGDSSVLFQGLNKHSGGARKHMEFDVEDYNLKLVQQINDSQAITLRGSYYEEDSNVPYSGLTLAEWQQFGPEYQPFVNDRFNADRWSLSATHEIDFSEDFNLKTSVYKTDFSRDWWRQSSNSGQRPNDASDPNCGSMANLSTTCGNEGRLRDYQTMGVEPRFSLNHGLFGADNTLEFGLRWHAEHQRRLQLNGDTPTARTAGTSVNGGMKENNRRDVEAWSGFVQNAFEFGDWTLTPGLRREAIAYERENLLKAVKGDERITETVWGLGVNYALGEDWALFGGVHEGFSPPNVQDVISDTTGGSIELDSEASVNYELGLRGRVIDGLNLEVTAFRMDFDNQIISASLAGGANTTATNGGETLHQGLEATVNFASDADFSEGGINWTGRLAATWLESAEFRGTRYALADAGKPLAQRRSVSGNQLPYAPELSIVGAAGFELASGLSFGVEGVYVDEVYTDDLNTKPVSANGQIGLIDSYTLWNVTANWKVADSGLTLFLSGKNVTDEEYVADMTRGLIPGMPRQILAGAEYAF